MTLWSEPLRSPFPGSKTLQRIIPESIQSAAASKLMHLEICPTSRRTRNTPHHMLAGVTRIDRRCSTATRRNEGDRFGKFHQVCLSMVCACRMPYVITQAVAREFSYLSCSESPSIAVQPIILAIPATILFGLI